MFYQGPTCHAPCTERCLTPAGMSPGGPRSMLRQEGESGTKVVAAHAALALQALLHHRLRGDAGVVRAGHPQHAAAAHAVPARQRVLRAGRHQRGSAASAGPPARPCRQGTASKPCIQGLTGARCTHRGFTAHTAGRGLRARPANSTHAQCTSGSSSQAALPEATACEARLLRRLHSRTGAQSQDTLHIQSSTARCSSLAARYRMQCVRAPGWTWSARGPGAASPSRWAAG